jgi:hypothetical protein|tara:strand:+ start:945 stop:1106 length:162 start_codon:yes stop_codon:yes gene_type:complete
MIVYCGYSHIKHSLKNGIGFPDAREYSFLRTRDKWDTGINRILKMKIIVNHNG